MSVRPGYKLTEMGQVPEEWAVARLGEVVATKKGKKPTTLYEKPDGRLPYLLAE